MMDLAKFFTILTLALSIHSSCCMNISIELDTFDLSYCKSACPATWSFINLSGSINYAVLRRPDTQLIGPMFLSFSSKSVTVDLPLSSNHASVNAFINPIEASTTTGQSSIWIAMSLTCNCEYTGIITPVQFTDDCYALCPFTNSTESKVINSTNNIFTLTYSYNYTCDNGTYGPDCATICTATGGAGTCPSGHYSCQGLCCTSFLNSGCSIVPTTTINPTNSTPAVSPAIGTTATSVLPVSTTFLNTAASSQSYSTMPCTLPALSMPTCACNGTSSDTQKQTYFIAMIVLAAVAGVLLIAFIITCCCCLRLKNSIIKSSPANRDFHYTSKRVAPERQVSEQQSSGLRPDLLTQNDNEPIYSLSEKQKRRQRSVPVVPNAFADYDDMDPGERASGGPYDYEPDYGNAENPTTHRTESYV